MKAERSAPNCDQVSGPALPLRPCPRISTEMMWPLQPATTWSQHLA